MKRLYTLAFILFSTGANAAYVSAGKLLESFTSKDETKVSIVIGYIVGVADSYSEQLCIPENTPVKDIVVKAMSGVRLLSQHHKESADVVVYSALSLAYGCGSRT